MNHSTGVITTIAGNGTMVSGDGGPGTAAELHYPWGLALDAAGDLFFADTWNNRVREINHSTGIITTVVAGLSGPEAVAFDAAGDMFISDT